MGDCQWIQEVLLLRNNICRQQLHTDVYLGAKLNLMQLENGVWAWGICLSKYVQKLYVTVKSKGKKMTKFYKLTHLAPNPFPTVHCPELDTSPELPSKHASYYQSLMGIYRWMIDLGRIDILIEVSMLPQHMALPQLRCLEADLDVMSYLLLQKLF